MSDDQSQTKVIEAGGLSFHIAYRHFGGDHGPAVMVYGDVEGKSVQLLRFDCFEHDPHYHYDPDRKNDQKKLDKVLVSDPVAWTIDRLRGDLVKMVEAAGYAQTAACINADAVVDVLPEITAVLASIS